MLTQLEASLGTAGATDVVALRRDGAPIDAEPVPVRSTRVTGPSLVLTEEGLGFLVGDELAADPGAHRGHRAPCRPSSIQVTAERDWAALRLDRRHRRAPGRRRVVRPARRPRRGSSTRRSTRSTSCGASRARSPAALIAFLLDGTAVEVADAWPGATQISAMAVSRDGTRMAALVTAGGAQRGVGRRDRPRRRRRARSGSGAPVPIGAVAGTGDRRSPGSTTPPSACSRTTARRRSSSSSSSADPRRRRRRRRGSRRSRGAARSATVRLRGEDGALYVRRGTNWQQSAAGILVLATQQGAPQR